MNYKTGEKIEIGDQVIDKSFIANRYFCKDDVGEVIVDLEKKQYHQDYPKHSWSDQDIGIMVRYKNYGDVFYSFNINIPYSDLILICKK